MNIRPTREEYLELSTSHERIPVAGERQIPSFNPFDLFRALYRDQPYAFLFESGKGPEATARYSFMGVSHRRVIQADAPAAVFSDNGTRETLHATPDAALVRIDLETKAPGFPHTPHFWGGWVGYLSYELAQYLDPVALRTKEDLGLPLLHFFEVDRLWVYDHQTGILKRIVSAKGTGHPESDYDRAVEEIHQAWQEAESILKTPDGTPEEPQSGVPFSATLPQTRVPRELYMDWVKRAQAYIAEGDIYQANLAHRFELDFEGDPLQLYERLRRVNPSPFSGFLKLDGLTLVSSSPERLVREQQGILETRPIAGTRPRGQNAEEDEQLQTELLLNEKEKAEHMMLVDLERNDMGRICEYGSVRVTDRMLVEQYSHVSHIVSNIQGTLRPGIRLIELLKAVFPGGTITGCPKIRCMEIIDELEPVTRGPYSGSFGYIGYDGTLDLNIIIRTLLLTGGKAYFHVGAGIVADSLPEREYEETLDKAAAMIQALTQSKEE